MINVNTDICRETIINYTNSIIDWFIQSDNSLKKNTTNDLMDMISESIKYSDILCKEYINNNMDIQAAVNQRCMTIIMIECYTMCITDIKECVNDLEDIINSKEKQDKIIDESIMLTEETLAMSYMIIGMDINNNKLYLQHIQSKEFIVCSGLFRFKEYTRFLLLSICKIKKEDMYITNSFVGESIVYLNVIKRDCIDKLDYGREIKIIGHEEYPKLINYTTNKLYIDMLNKWKYVDWLNNTNIPIFITNSSETANNLLRKIYESGCKNATVLNTFGLNKLPDIIFDDIVVLDSLNFTTEQIKERTYNSAKTFYIISKTED